MTEAGTTFPTAYDGHGVLSRLLDFKAVPNGLLVDARGVLRWAKFGGFSIDNPADVATVERFFAGEDPGPSPVATEPYALAPVERELIQTKLRLGELLMQTGQRAEALATWRDALRLDPANFTIRKQIWAAEHPAKFFPDIDFDWQQEQLAAERSREIADGVCGPDGCPFAWA